MLVLFCKLKDLVFMMDILRKINIFVFLYTYKVKNFFKEYKVHNTRIAFDTYFAIRVTYNKRVNMFCIFLIR